ncbi:pseudouridylate synthase [Ornithinimicrobium sp. Arc0846-15]|nr:pseudouridylate synthase [Ornithinimicrobium laminariae]
MPPRSPLPTRYGLAAAWVCTPDRDASQPLPWSTMSVWLRDKLTERVQVARLLDEERFVYADGSPVAGNDPYAPHTFVWFHRDLPDETPVAGQIQIVHRDERLVVIDKPAFLSSIPRGQHIRESVVVRLREGLGLPELTPLHRLDRITSGLLVCATQQRWRGPYQSLFQSGGMAKTYRALAPICDDLELPTTVANHISKPRGATRAEVTPGAPINAETHVTLETHIDGLGLYRLIPRTGRTHQLRVHLNDLGIPIVGDPLYPNDLAVAIDDFSQPLQLLAAEIAFVDPIDGAQRRFVSTRQLPLSP